MSTGDMFDQRGQENQVKWAPLATRMRPRTFDEFVGQDHIVGGGTALRRAVEMDQVPSLVLWGPPGSGKTTLAYLISSISHSFFEPLSAVDSGVSDLRNAMSAADRRLGLQGQRTILFIDEIHRFSKSQQDVILPFVENGRIVLIGATTENPSFEVIAPLLSRSRVYTLRQLETDQVKILIDRAVMDCERGLGHMKVELDAETVNFLVSYSGGDARVALNSLEFATHATSPNAEGHRIVRLTTMEQVLQRRAVLYDKTGDQHYDIISAFIKSVRGSDPDASLYWLCRMIEAGESPGFIARRLIILASEDIGLANPYALSIAVATQQAVHFVGMPEGRIALAEATVYLAASPKSNSTIVALDKAMNDVRGSGNQPVPLHLRNAVTGLMGQLGYGEGYKYSHNYDGNFANQDFLPSRLKGHRYYSPGMEGAEEEIGKRLRELWQNPNKA